MYLACVILYIWFSFSSSNDNWALIFRLLVVQGFVGSNKILQVYNWELNVKEAINFNYNLYYETRVLKSLKVVHVIIFGCNTLLIKL